MKIEILGMGCPKCKQLASNAETAVKELNINVDISKVTDINKITEYGVMMTPALAVDGKVVSSGKLLSKDDIKKIITGVISVNGNKGEDSKNDIVCGQGCSCGKPLGNTKAKSIVCLVVLLAVCSILVYKTKSTKQITLPNTETAFAVSTANQINEQVIVVPNIDKQDSAVKSVEDKIRIGEYLDSLSLLNKVAINQDAVFVFVPAKQDETVNKETIDAIASAEQKLKSNGISIGLYTLRVSSPSKEYANIAAQLTLPGILVMSKGQGMGTVSGEITETKLLQAYVASSRTGGCCPSGSGSPSSCK